MGYIMDLRREVGHRPIIIPGAAVLFFNEKNEILLHERAVNGFWGYPGGSMEFGETFEDTAKREALEESGLICDELEFFDTESGEETHYTYPHGDDPIDGVTVASLLGKPQEQIFKTLVARGAG